MKVEGKLEFIKNTVSNLRIVKNAYRWKLKDFRQKESIYIESKKYIIKTIESIDELEKVLNLRHKIFYEERNNNNYFIKIDFDKFDLICDHLIIIDKNINSIVATYRLISSTFADTFYSESYFDISNIISKKGVKLELGRACVHPEYRSGPVMMLLWKGLSEYMKEVRAKYLFGCSDIPTTNIVEASLLYKYVKDLYLSSDDLRVYPTYKYKIHDFSSYLETYDKYEINTDKVQSLISPLLKGYFKAGSVICGEPVIDKNWGRTRLFTVLDVDAISESHEKKYKNYEVAND